MQLTLFEARRTLTIVTFIATGFMASCAKNLPPVIPPEKPTPTWATTDFECEGDPPPPPQETTKADAEIYTARTLSALRGCRDRLKARGNEAAAFGYVIKAGVPADVKNQ